jgi:phosphoribosylglycinamide formyltransferase 2
MTEREESGPVTEGPTKGRPTHGEGEQSPTDPPEGEQPRADTGNHRIRVMLLGSGEFSRELVIIFQRLGVEVIAVEGHAPTHAVADQSLVVTMTDTDELAAAIGRLRPHFVVTATDVVAADALTAVADALTAAAETGFTEVFPTARSARLAVDREGLRRLAADELGLPTAPFWFVGSLDELRAVANHTGYPLRVEPATPAAGRGGSVISAGQDVEPAWQRAVSGGGPHADNRVLAEAVVEIDVNVTLLTVRSDGPAGEVIEFCAPIGHSGAGGDAAEFWQPQPLSPAAIDAAKSIAARIVTALGGRGVFGVELMVHDDEVYFCDVDVWPRESGLVTLRTQRLSELELQARSILGLTIDTIMISPGAAQVIYSGHDVPERSWDADGALAEALRVPESDVRVFGHHHPDGEVGGGGSGQSGHADGRCRLGVAVVTAADVTTARDRARQVSAALRTFWQP